ncbi:MAG: transglutaminase domain-containing protein [Burkholderiales bacterium]|nr:transglutaminase domain-containing protein [Burkholderiales bacterium]
MDRPTVLPPVEQRASQDDPGLWLGSTPLLDLGDARLSIRARALTQLCKTEREKALAIYGFVKRIPFAKPFKLRLHTPREVLDAGRGDAVDKVSLFVALLRIVKIPARVRYIEVRGEMFRGLISGMSEVPRLLAEVWLDGRWLATDTYVFDAVYMAAARQRLEEQGWECGYGIHRNGNSIWNGMESAYLGGIETAKDPMVLGDLGVFNDALEFMSSEAFSSMHPLVSRTVGWNLMAPAMNKVVRDLHEEGSSGMPAAPRKAS